MKAPYSMGNHNHFANRKLQTRRGLIAMLIVSLSTPATGLFAQGSSSRLLTRDLSGQNTVSTNQLRTSNKTLQSVQRARNHLFVGRIDEAQKEITRALTISPDCAMALNIQGAIHLERRQFEEADKKFHEAIQADSELGSAYLGLAMSLIARNRLEDALGPLDHATSLLPGSWLTYFEAAIAHLGLGDTQGALKQISYAERFTGTKPARRSATVYVRGMAYIDLKEYDRGKKYLEDAIAFDPSGFYAALALRKLEYLGPIPADAR